MQLRAQLAPPALPKPDSRRASPDGSLSLLNRADVRGRDFFCIAGLGADLPHPPLVVVFLSLFSTISRRRKRPRNCSFFALALPSVKRPLRSGFGKSYPGLSFS